MLCVASKSELLLFRWEEDRFIPNHALQLSSPPRCIMFWRFHLVVGLEVGFELIHPDPENAVSQLLFASPSKESKPLDAVVLNDELLLCFTSMSFVSSHSRPCFPRLPARFADVGIFVNIDGIKTRSFDVKWNTVPTSFVYIYPYLLVFSPISIEVRTLVNGNMVQSISPDEGMHNFHLLTTSQGIFYSSRATTGSHSTIHQLKLGAPLAAAKKAAARRAGSTTNLIGSSPPASPGGSPNFRASSMPGLFPPGRNMSLPMADPSPFNIRSMENSEDAADDVSRPSPRSSSSTSRSSSPREHDRIQRAQEMNQTGKIGIHQKMPSDPSTPPLTPLGRQTMSDSNTPRVEDARGNSRGRRRPRPVSVGFPADQSVSPRESDSTPPPTVPIGGKRTAKNKRSALKSSGGGADSNDSSEGAPMPAPVAPAEGSDERSGSPSPSSPSTPTSRSKKGTREAKGARSPRKLSDSPKKSSGLTLAVPNSPQASSSVSPRSKIKDERSPRRSYSTVPVGLASPPSAPNKSPRSPRSSPNTGTSKKAGDIATAEIPSSESTSSPARGLSKKRSKVLNTSGEGNGASGPPEKKDA